MDALGMEYSSRGFAIRRAALGTMLPLDNVGQASKEDILIVLVMVDMFRQGKVDRVTCRPNSP
jgi:hypothetical protein